MTNATESLELTRVGPATPMGALMRQYWLPALMSSELKAGGDPVRLLRRCRALARRGGAVIAEVEAERERLSSRERGIVELIAQGQSNKEIARTLGITPETVKSHIKSVFTKLEVDKRAQAVSRAQALGLVKHS